MKKIIGIVMSLLLVVAFLGLDSLPAYAESETFNITEIAPDTELEAGSYICNDTGEWATISWGYYKSDEWYISTGVITPDAYANSSAKPSGGVFTVSNHVTIKKNTFYIPPAVAVYVPAMKTVNVNGETLNTWEEIAVSIPEVTSDKLEKSGNSDDALLQVNIVSKEDKTIPANAVQALDKSSIDGLHVFIGESDAITFLNNSDYSDYPGKSFNHNDTTTESSRTIDFADKGLLNSSVVFHTLISPKKVASIYKIVDGNETFMGTVESNEVGAICFAIDELATYILRY